MYYLTGKRVINFNQENEVHYKIVYLTEEEELEIDPSQYTFKLSSERNDVSLSPEGVLDVSKTLVSQNIVIICEFEGHAISKGVSLRDASFFQEAEGENMSSEAPPPMAHFDPDFPVNSRLFGEIIADNERKTQEIAELNARLPQNINDQVTVLQLGMVEQFEENLRLQDDITKTQIAITELFESMIGGANNG